MPGQAETPEVLAGCVKYRLVQFPPVIGLGTPFLKIY